MYILENSWNLEIHLLPPLIYVILLWQKSFLDPRLSVMELSSFI